MDLLEIPVLPEIVAVTVLLAEMVLMESPEKPAQSVTQETQVSMERKELQADLSQQLLLVTQVTEDNQETPEPQESLELMVSTVWTDFQDLWEIKVSVAELDVTDPKVLLDL